MRSRLTPLIKLFYNPLQAMIEISAGAPYVVGAALALFATFAYYETLSGRLIRITGALDRGRTVGMAAPFVPMIYRIVSQASPILFLIVGCSRLLAGKFDLSSSKFQRAVRQEYRRWQVARYMVGRPRT
jgi:hypothetical protein